MRRSPAGGRRLPSHALILFVAIIGKSIVCLAVTSKLCREVSREGSPTWRLCPRSSMPPGGVPYKPCSGHVPACQPTVQSTGI
jgi:hypothetical protein